jgi:hypothetical protein
MKLTWITDAHLNLLELDDRKYFIKISLRVLLWSASSLRSIKHFGSH